MNDPLIDPPSAQQPQVPASPPPAVAQPSGLQMYYPTQQASTPVQSGQPALPSAPPQQDYMTYRQFLDTSLSQFGKNSKNAEPELTKKMWDAYHDNYLPSQFPTDAATAKAVVNVSKSMNPYVGDIIIENGTTAPDPEAEPRYQDEALSTQVGRTARNAIGGVVSGVGSLIDFAQYLSMGIANTMRDDDDQLTEVDKFESLNKAADFLHELGGSIHKTTDFATDLSKTWDTDKGAAMDMLFSADGVDHILTDFLPTMIGEMGGSGGGGVAIAKTGGKLIAASAGRVGMKQLEAQAKNLGKKGALTRYGMMSGMVMGAGGATGRETEDMIRQKVGKMTNDEFFALDDLKGDKQYWSKLTGDQQTKYKELYVDQMVSDSAGLATIAGAAVSLATMKLAPATENLVATALTGKGVSSSVGNATFMKQVSMETLFNGLDEAGQVVSRDASISLAADSQLNGGYSDIGSRFLIGAAAGGGIHAATRLVAIDNKMGKARSVAAADISAAKNIPSFVKDAYSKLQNKNPLSKSNDLQERASGGDSGGRGNSISMDAALAAGSVKPSADKSQATATVIVEGNKGTEIDVGAIAAKQDGKLRSGKLDKDGYVESVVAGVEKDAAAKLKKGTIDEATYDSTLLQARRIAEGRAINQNPDVAIEKLSVTADEAGLNGVFDTMTAALDQAIGSGALTTNIDVVEHLTKMLKSESLTKSIESALKNKAFDWGELPLKIDGKTSADDVLSIVNEAMMEKFAIRPVANADVQSLMDNDFDQHVSDAMDEATKKFTENALNSLKNGGAKSGDTELKSAINKAATSVLVDKLSEEMAKKRQSFDVSTAQGMITKSAALLTSDYFDSLQAGELPDMGVSAANNIDPNNLAGTLGNDPLIQTNPAPAAPPAPDAAVELAPIQAFALEGAQVQDAFDTALTTNVISDAAGSVYQNRSVNTLIQEAGGAYQLSSMKPAEFARVINKVYPLANIKLNAFTKNALAGMQTALANGDDPLISAQTFMIAANAGHNRNSAQVASNVATITMLARVLSDFSGAVSTRIDPALQINPSMLGDGSNVKGVDAKTLNALTDVAHNVHAAMFGTGFTSIKVQPNDAAMPLKNAGQIGSISPDGNGRYTVHINASRVRNAAEIEAVIAHEIGHVGLRAMGNDGVQLVSKTVKSLGGIDNIRKLATRAGIDVAKYAKQANGRMPESHILIDELVAHAFERGDTMTGLGRAKLYLKETYENARAALANMGLKRVPQWGDAGIAALVRRSNQALLSPKSGGVYKDTPAFRMASTDGGAVLDGTNGGWLGETESKMRPNALYRWWRGFDADGVQHYAGDLTAKFVDGTVGIADRFSQLAAMYDKDAQGNTVADADYELYRNKLNSQLDELVANAPTDEKLQPKHDSAVKALEDKLAKGTPKYTAEMDVRAAITRSKGVAAIRKNNDLEELWKPIEGIMSKGIDDMLEAGELNTKVTADVEDAIASVNRALHAQHAAERDYMGALLKGKLDDKKGAQRKEYIEQYLAGELDAQTTKSKLAELAGDEATAKAVEEGHYSGMPAAMNTAIQSVLMDNPVLTQLVSDISNQMKLVTAKTNERNNNSGRFSTDDGKMLDLMGYENYVPLTRDADEQVAMTPNNIGDFIAGTAQFFDTQAVSHPRNINPLKGAKRGLMAAADNVGNAVTTKAILAYAREFGDVHGLKVREAGKVFNLDANGRQKAIKPHGANTVSHVENGVRFDVTFSTKHGTYGNSNVVMMKGLLHHFSPTPKNLAASTVGKVTRVISATMTLLNPLYLRSAYIREPVGMIQHVMHDTRVGGKEGNAFFGQKQRVLAALIPTLMNPLNSESMGRLGVAYFNKKLDERAVIGEQAIAANRLIENGADRNIVGYAHRLAKAGGETSMLSAMDMSLEQKAGNTSLASAITPTSLDKVGKSWAYLTEKAGTFYAGMDMATRTHIFKALVDGELDGKKWTDEEAAAYTKELMDFDRTGTATHLINPWLVFFKSSSLGAQSFMQRLTLPDGSLNYPMMAFHIASSAAMYMTAAAILGQDDDGIDKLAKMSSGAAMGNMVLPFEDDNGNPYVLPKAYGMSQVLGGIGVAIARVTMGHGEIGETAVAWAVNAKNSIQPLSGTQDGEAAGMATALTPQMLKPLVEIWANKNSFGGDIHSRYGGEGGMNAPDHLQGRSTTGDFWKGAASGLSSIGIETHPESIRHFVQGYTGGAGNYIGKLIDQITREEHDPAGAFGYSGADALTGVAFRTEKSREFYLKDAFTDIQTQIKGMELGESSGNDKLLRAMAIKIKPVLSQIAKNDRKGSKLAKQGRRDLQQKYREKSDALRGKIVYYYLNHK